jgi:hypothetical protein
LLVVSANLGDAALSCAALLDRVDPVTVLDVFTLVPEPDHASEWDRACGFATASDAMAAHEEEEATAFADGFHEVLAVDLLAHRYGGGRRGTVDERRLRDALTDWVHRCGACTVVLPAGAGLVPGSGAGLGARLRALFGGRRSLHVDPDHLWVRDTAAQVLDAHDAVEIWLYDEFPHGRSRHADAAVGLFAGWLRRRAELHIVPVDRAAKARRIGVYSSLAEGWFRMRSPRRIARRIPRTERYWALHRQATSP